MEWLTSLLLAFFFAIGPAAEGRYADLVYYFNTNNGCKQNLITLAAGQKATVKESSITGQESSTCSITFYSPGGFDVEFEKGRIYDCGVTITLQTSSASTLRSYSCGRSFKGEFYWSNDYLTFTLIKSNPSSRNYEFEVEIKGNARTSRSYVTFYPGIIAAIIISAVISLLCCILVPIAVWCWVRRRRRRYSEPQVVYPAPPPGCPVDMYERPVYIKH